MESGFFTGTTLPSIPSRRCTTGWPPGRQVLPHPPYSPDLAPADFFFFTKMKDQLAGCTLTQESFKTTWDGVVRTIATEEFAAAAGIIAVKSVSTMAETM